MHFHGLFPLDKLLEIEFLGQKFYTFLRIYVGPLHPPEKVHHSPQWWTDSSFPVFATAEHSLFNSSNNFLLSTYCFPSTAQNY